MVLSQRFTLVSSRNSRPITEQVIELRNSALLGLWALAFDHPGGSVAEVVLDRNLLISRVTLSSLGRHRILNSKFTVERNIIDARQTLISASKAFPERLRPGFSWSGSENIYNTGSGYVEGSNRSRRVNGIATLESWKSFVQERGSVEAQVIRRDRITDQGSVNIMDIDLETAISIPSRSVDQPDAGPNFQLVGPGDKRRQWLESQTGVGWREQQERRWQDK